MQQISPSSTLTPISPELIAYTITLCSLIALIVFTVVEYILPLLGIGKRRNRPPLPPLNQQEAQALQETAQRMRRRRLEHQNEEQECVICLGEFENPVEVLDCGHLYCSECLLALVQTRNFAGKCPTCRDQIKLILPAFHRRPQNQTAEEIMRTFPDDLRRFNHNNPIELHQAFINNGNHFQAVMNYALRNFNRLPPRIKGRIIVLVITGIGYLISPIDFIPDGIPIFGFMDDLVLIIVLLIIAFAIVRNMFR